MNRSRRLPLLVFAAALLPFLPILLNGYVDWDDPVFIVKNPFLANFDVGWMLTSTMNGHYHPLTWLSLAIDRALWGPIPLGVHVTSALLHAGCAVLAFLLAERLLGDEEGWAAAFAALLFAVHPLRVESVAWAIERKDVLSGFFYLLTLWLWLEDKPRPALAAFAASLLSKGIGVTLPVALALVDKLGRGRPLDRAWLKRVAPFAALSVAFGALGLWTALGYWVHSADLGAPPLERFPMGARLAVAAYGLCFYPLKTLCPTGLAPLYPPPASPALDEWPFWLCAALVVVAAYALVRWGRARPKLAAGALFYGATIAPVLGVFRFGPQLAADRFSYLACLPFALLGGAALQRALADENKRSAAAAAAATLLVALSGLTARQLRFWRSSEALWTRELQIVPSLPMAHHSLANALMARGMPDAAERRERAALKTDPGYVHARNGLGLALAAQGRFEEALPEYQAAAAARPDYWEAYANLGMALTRLRRYEEAWPQFEKALALNPDKPELHGNFGLALLTAGLRQRGVAELETALRLNPDQPRLASIYASLRRAPTGRTAPR